jgi:hypothetical protein
MLVDSEHSEGKRGVRRMRVKKKVANKKSRKGHNATQVIDGCVYELDEEFFLSIRGNLFRFVTEKACRSWTEWIIPVSALPKADGVLGFRDGSLLSRFANGNLYLVSNNKTRHITSPDVLFDYGLSDRPIIEVSEGEFNVHDEGETIDA